MTQPPETLVARLRATDVELRLFCLRGHVSANIREAASRLEALEAALEAKGWHPIESAPRDGTAVLELMEALREAASWFDAYADEHLAKGSADKAVRNKTRANILRTAIARAEGVEPEGRG